MCTLATEPVVDVEFLHRILGTLEHVHARRVDNS
jgi:hypothetical protein